MTEAEWLACGEPKTLLRPIWSELTERKLSLVAIACSRRLWHMHAERRFRSLIESAERVVEGLLDQMAFQNELRTFRLLPLNNCRTLAESGAHQAFAHPMDQRELVLGLNALAAAVAWKKRPNAAL